MQKYFLQLFLFKTANSLDTDITLLIIINRVDLSRRPFSRINDEIALFGLMLIINLIQSAFSPLLNDEGYYWLYAQYPQWGYFDHPPMIAFLIRIGTSLFPGEVGVRLMTSIIGSLTFFLVYKIIEVESGGRVNIKLAALLLLSSLFLNLYSFMALPDTPMLFVAALFLYVYRRYLDEDNVANALLVGVTAALLLYSKYHGILLIGLTLLSNPKLLLKRSFYIIFITALFLFIPHIYWEVTHDYPTLRFQFAERSGTFKLQHVFSYLSEQAGLTGPIILLLFSMLYKAKNQFQKTLKYITGGVFVFFLMSSLKESVNLHWTAIAWPAMLCLAYLYINGFKKYHKLVYGLLTANLVIIIFLRINFIGGVFPMSNFNDKNPRLMTKLLIDKAGNYPLVFKDMYNEPACFMFYSHRQSYAFNTIWYKKTQFNYLPQLEDPMQSKTVSVVSIEPVNSSSREIAVTKGKKYFITTISNYASFNTSIFIKANPFHDIAAAAESTINFTLTNTLTVSQKDLFKQKGGSFILTFINRESKESFNYKYNKEIDFQFAGPLTFRFKAPSKKGDYNCIFSVSTADSFLLGFNSNTYKCSVK